MVQWSRSSVEGVVTRMQLGAGMPIPTNRPVTLVIRKKPLVFSG